MVHVKDNISEDVDMNNIFSLDEELCVRYQTECHENATGKPNNPDEVKSVYYRCVRVIATKWHVFSSHPPINSPSKHAVCRYFRM